MGNKLLCQTECQCYYTEKNQDEDSIFKHYIKDSEISKGNFGRVYKCEYCSGSVDTHYRNYNSRIYVAIKELNMYDINKRNQDIDTILKEVEMLQRCNHPYLMNYLEYDFNKTETLEHAKGYIVTEYVEGYNLHQFLHMLPEENFFTEHTVKSIVWQVLQGVNFLHNQGIMHRDIKLENVLLDQTDPEDIKIKIVDLGISTYMESIIYTNFQTLNYISPEFIRKEKYNQKIDVWAIGVLMYYLLFKEPPFEQTDISKKFENIKNINIDFNKFGIVPSEECMKVFKNIFVLDTNVRMSCSDLLELPWFKEFNSNPADRVKVPKVAIDTNPLNIERNIINYTQANKLFRAIKVVVVKLNYKLKNQKDIRMLFETLDTYKTGSINTHVFRDFLSQNYPHLDPYDLDELADSLDNNGSILYNDFMAGVCDYSMTEDLMLIDYIFYNLMKQNKFTTDVKSIKTNIESMLTKLNINWTDLDIQKIIDDIDCDQDGQISVKDFCDYIHAQTGVEMNSSRYSELGQSTNLTDPLDLPNASILQDVQPPKNTKNKNKSSEKTKNEVENEYNSNNLSKTLSKEDFSKENIING